MTSAAVETTTWELKTPVQIYLRDDLPHLAGHSQQISTQTIHIEIGVKLPLKSTITIEIYFPRDSVFDFMEQDPLTLKAKVETRTVAEDQKSWKVTLVFLEMTEEAVQKILTEIKSL